MLYLPDGLSWSLLRGESDPVLGWYSSRSGRSSHVGSRRGRPCLVQPWTLIRPSWSFIRSPELGPLGLAVGGSLGQMYPTCFGGKPMTIDLS